MTVAVEHAACLARLLLRLRLEDSLDLIGGGECRHLLVDVTRGRALILRRPDVRPILMRRTQRTWFWCEGGSRFHLERGGGLRKRIASIRPVRTGPGAVLPGQAEYHLNRKKQ